jgi:hypothetical protein
LNPTSINVSASAFKLGPVLWQLAVHAGPWVMLFGGIGLVLALLACIVLARTGLLQRHRRDWHLAAKLSYVLILLALPIAGAALGMVHGTQRAFAESVHTALMPALEQRMPALRVYLASRLSSYQPGQPASVRELIEPLVQQMYYRPRSNSLWERTKARWMNEILLRGAAAQFEQVLQQQLMAQAARVGAVLSGPDFKGRAGSDLARLGSEMAVKFTTNMAKEIDFSVLDKSLPQVFADALIRHFNGVFASARNMILALLSGLLLLLTVEIVVYRRYFKLPQMVVTAVPMASSGNATDKPAAEAATGASLVASAPAAPAAPAARGPLPCIAYLSVFVRCWLVPVVVALLSWLLASLMGQSTLSNVVSLLGVVIGAVVGVPVAAALLVMFAFYRRRLDPHCSPAAFAWTYVASLFPLGGFAWCCYTYDLKPGNSLALLVLMIVVPWLIGFALCLTARHLLLRPGPRA